ncbi:hypothetical protein GCM10027449_18470 [Sinomonas notoginsengisoli]
MRIRIIIIIPSNARELRAEEHPMTDTVPPDWAPRPWLEPFTRRELQWLAERLDAANRQLRIANRRLVQLADTQEDPWNARHTGPDIKPAAMIGDGHRRTARPSTSAPPGSPTLSANSTTAS